MNQNELVAMSPRERSQLEKVIFEEWTVEGRQETLEVKKDESPLGRSGKRSPGQLSPSPTNSGVLDTSTLQYQSAPAPDQATNFANKNSNMNSNGNLISNGNVQNIASTLATISKVS